jgi:hypothetical protein
VEHLTRTGKRRGKPSLDKRSVSSATRAAVIQLAESIEEERKNREQKNRKRNLGGVLDE